MQTTVEVIKDSIGPNKVRLTTFLCIYPRIIHAEHLRHRTQSFSVASSRAIPYSKVRKQVDEDPFIPLAFQKAHKGMQGSEYIAGSDLEEAEHLWRCASNQILKYADDLEAKGVTKQLLNRLIEPWTMTRVVCTATEWENFFSLRINPAAEIHIQDLAKKMKAAMDASSPEYMEAGRWHCPFIDGDDYQWAIDRNLNKEDRERAFIKISAARNARTSYGKNIGKSIEEEFRLTYDLLLDRHLGPFEHICQATNFPGDKIGLDCDYYDELDRIDYDPRGIEIRLNRVGGKTMASMWSGNMRGWIQYRKTLEGESGTAV